MHSVSLVRDHPGFTIIELMVVVAVVVVLAAIGPMMTSGTIIERQVYNAGAQLQQDLLRAQNLAVTYATDPALHPSDASLRRFEVYFDVPDNRYYVESSADAIFDASTMTVVAGKVITRQLSSSLSLAPDSTITARGYVVFDSQGAPWPATTGDTISISTRAGDKVVVVAISPIGRISVAWQTR
jgi:prepilin-type N-terminal cleavage/methylation domain-containing protein